jgi:GNAT superfamily N-acetyltransferase
MLTLKVAGATNNAMCRQFIPPFRAAFERSPGAFFKLTDEEIAMEGAKLALVFVDGRAVAGARALADGSRSLYVGQCFCDPEFQGRRLIARAVAGLRVSFFDQAKIAGAHLVVRMTDGRDNEAAVRAYERVGFVRGAAVKTELLPDDPSSAHLLETVTDGKLEVRQMAATPFSMRLCQTIIDRFYAAEEAQRYGIGG